MWRFVILSRFSTSFEHGYLRQIRSRFPQHCNSGFFFQIQSGIFDSKGLKVDVRRLPKFSLVAQQHASSYRSCADCLSWGAVCARTCSRPLPPYMGLTLSRRCSALIVLAWIAPRYYCCTARVYLGQLVNVALVLPWIHRCLRVRDSDFSTYFDDYLERWHTELNR